MFPEAPIEDPRDLDGPVCVCCGNGRAEYEYLGMCETCFEQAQDASTNERYQEEEE